MKKRNLIFYGLTIFLFSKNLTAQLPIYIPANGLIRWYTFNGNADDESINTNDGLVYDANLVENRFGVNEKAYLFNGASSYIETSSIILQDFTISSWFNLSLINLDNLSSVYSNIGNVGHDGLELRIEEDSTLVFVIGDGMSWNHISNTGIKVSPNQWYHSVITKESGVIKVYLNSMLIVESNMTLNNSLTDFNIGTRSTDVNGGWFTGKIDDIGIWDRALNNSEIGGLDNYSVCYEYITVTDTLLIDVSLGLPGLNDNTLKIFPNPAKTNLTINTGDFLLMNDWTIKIVNSQSQEVFNGVLNQVDYVLDITLWSEGIYFVQLIDEGGNTIDVKKIVLQ